MCHRVRLADQQWTAVGRLLCRRQKNASVRHLSISNQSSIDADNRREKSNDFDIIINGGGIVGLTFLLGLQKSPFLKDKKVLLLERQPPPLSSPSSTSNNDHKTFSNRVSSLTESSRQLFKRLGLWDSLDPHAKRIDRMHVWSYDFHKAIRFRNKVDHTLDLRISSSTTTPQSGLQRLPDDDCVCHIVENDRISKALNDQIDQQRIAYSSQVRRIAANQNLVQLQLQDDQTLTTKLLIGCDGFNSLVRTSSSFTQRSFEMDQMGIVGTVQMDPNSINSQNSISYQRFLPQLDSVLALLPLDQTRCSFVLSTTRNRCEQWMAMTDGQFVDQLNELLHTHLTYNDGKSIIKSIVNQMDQLVSSVLPRSMTQAKSFSTAPTVESLHSSSRAAFPLGFATTLPNLAGSVNDNAFINVALIGDSAHRIHPLAGQGLNLGIGDAEVLCDTLESWASRGEPLFACARDPLQSESLQTCLLQFERQRLVKLFCILSAVQSMACLFEYTTPQMLQLFDKLDFVKQQIVQFANRN